MKEKSYRDNLYAGCKIATKHFDSVETESETDVDQGDAEPEENFACTLKRNSSLLDK